MESIRSRIAARDNSTVTNEDITGTFKNLGLYNNNSASLQDANNAAAAGAGTTPPATATLGQINEPYRLVSIAEALAQAKRKY
jgi:hypothetical protein